MSSVRPASQRGYSIIELAVSLGIFLVLATLISLAVARSLGAASTARVARASESVMTNELNKLSSVPYAQLLNATFTVPDPCPGTPTGITGQSCVHAGAATMKIRYQFQDVDSAGTPVCSTTTTGQRTSDTLGYVGLCANVVDIAGAPAPKASLGLAVTARVNAPGPGYAEDAGTVRVKLTGSWRDVEGSSLFLLKANDPTHQVASANVTSSTVLLTVPAGPDVQATDTCTRTDPCLVGLNPAATPAQLDTRAVYGAATTPDARLAVTAGGLTEASVRVAARASATPNRRAVNGPVHGAPSVPGSVCLWATFVDGTVRRSVPACNSANPAQVVLDSYDPQWDTANAGRSRLPFPLDTPITLTVDHPDGVCYRAPGMYGSVPGSHVSGQPDDWAPRAVCTSYTWGVPTGLTSPVVLGAGDHQTRTLTWDATAAGHVAAPAAGYPGNGEVWVKPRQADSCSLDATCSTVVGLAMEAQECPDQFCYSGQNRNPAVVTPVNRLFANNTYGTSPVYTLTIDDPEGDPVTVSTGAQSLGAGTLRWASSTDGPFTDVPADGTPLGTAVAGKRTLYFTYTRAQDDQQLHTIDLVLSDGVTDSTTSSGDGRTETIGLYYNDSPWAVTTSDISVAQGGSATGTLTVTTTSGAPADGANVTLSASNPDLTFETATVSTNAQGVATFALHAGSVAAGRYTVVATLAGGQHTQATVTVTAAPGALSVSAVGAPQGQQGHIQVHATDKSGAPMAHVVASLSVLRDGTVDQNVYPKYSGCSTGSDGTCTVPLMVDPHAPAGTYQVRAGSGAYVTPDFDIQVTPTPAALVTDPVTGAPTVQGQGTSAHLTLLDKSAAPLADTKVTFTTPSPDGLTISPQTVTTSADGTVDVVVTAPASLGAGTYTVTGRTADGLSSDGTLDLPFTIAVTAATSTLDYTALTLAQGTSGDLTVAVHDGAGNPNPGQLVTFSTTAAGVTVGSRAVSGTDGTARTSLAVDSTTAAGTYRVRALVDGAPFDLDVKVTGAPASITVSGVVTQGGSDQKLQVTVTDSTGVPVPTTQVAVTSAYSTLTLTGSPATTDVAGQAIVRVSDVGPTPAGVYLLDVTAGSVHASVPVTVVATVASLEVNPTAVTAPAGATTSVTVTALDLTGAPATGRNVRAELTSDTSTMSGLSVSTPANTDSAGHTQLSVVAAADAAAQSATLTLTCETATLSIPVTVSP